MDFIVRKAHSTFEKASARVAFLKGCRCLKVTAGICNPRLLAREWGALPLC